MFLRSGYRFACVCKSPNWVPETPWTSKSLTVWRRPNLHKGTRSTETSVDLKVAAKPEHPGTRNLCAGGGGGMAGGEREVVSERGGRKPATPSSPPVEKMSSKFMFLSSPLPAQNKNPWLRKKP
jgi:hypothetical protein